MSLSRFWNRWISVLSKPWCSEVLSTVSSSQTQLVVNPLENTISQKKKSKHSGTEAVISVTVYLQFIEPLDPWSKVKLIDITCKWRLPVLEKEKSFIKRPGKGRKCLYLTIKTQLRPKHRRSLRSFQSLQHVAAAQCGGCTPTRQPLPPTVLPAAATSVVLTFLPVEQAHKVGRTRQAKWASLPAS